VSTFLHLRSKVPEGSDKIGPGTWPQVRALGPGRGGWHTLAAVHRSSLPVELDPRAFVGQLDAISTVYAAAMRPDPGHLPGRRSIMAQHATYAGFRALAVSAAAADAALPARDGWRVAGRGSQAVPRALIAFAYGFRGERGQWWHDIVRSAITARADEATAAAWLDDSLEIAEVHVHPDYQHRGIGTRLVLGLTAGRAERTAALSTQDANSTARRLYRRLGFSDLLTGYSFPGVGPPYAVMGAVLPLAAAVSPS
jgi:ribosomal protein S18 acetylase RimI-like enzyme